MGLSAIGSALLVMLLCTGEPLRAKPQTAVSSVEDFSAFDRLARRENVPGAFGIRELKFLLTGVDGPRPLLHLIDTRRFPMHYDFWTGGLGQPDIASFHASTYWTEKRQNLAGSITYHESYQHPDGRKGLYAIELWPTDPVRVGLIDLAYQSLTKAMPFAAGLLAYHPSGEMQERLHAEKSSSFEQRGVPVVSTAELFGRSAYRALHQGECIGRLRLIDPASSDQSSPTVRDIALFRRIPSEAVRTAGIITEAPQTPLSHLNLLARQNGTPNAFIKDASSDPRLAPLLGTVVSLRVGPDGFEVRAATAQEAASFLRKLRPEKPRVLVRDLSSTTIRPLGSLDFSSAASVGAKAAQLAELGRILPRLVPSGHAIPFSFYDDFMKVNGLYAEAARMMKEGAFRIDAGARERRLEAFRKKIRSSPVPEHLTRALEALASSLPKGQPIRLRSSTNCEDLLGFNGAGLYASKTHRPEEGSIVNTVRQVWASLWTFRAFEERAFHRIDHLSAAMGILVHRNYDDELANGVAITRNIFDPSTSGLYINAQVGESLITQPDGSTPDELLLVRLAGASKLEAQYIQRSNRTQNGAPVLSRESLDALVEAMGVVHDHFSRLYQKVQDPSFAMDVEWKVDADGQLVIKQARPAS